jgi:putative membrane protein
MRSRALNTQVFLETLCFLTFGGVIFYLTASGRYLAYVTPRMAPYLYFTSAVMLVWAVVGLGRLFQPRYKVRSAHCFVLVLPLLLLLLPHSPLSTAELAGNYLGAGALSSQSAAAVTVPPASTPIPPATDTQSALSPPEDLPQTTAAEPPSPVYEEEAPLLAGLDEAARTIVVSNDDFGSWLSELYVNMERYEGYTIVTTGYVFKDPAFIQDGEFVPARLMMSCCAADLVPVGLLCHYDEASQLEADSWVTVEGTLFIAQIEYEGQSYDDPQLKVTKVTPAQAVEGYVYPY